MPRQAWVVAVGASHHPTRQQPPDVFLFDVDRRRYLDALREQCLRHDFTLPAGVLIGPASPYAAGGGS